MDLAELAYRYKNANTDAEKAELKAKLEKEFSGEFAKQRSSAEKESREIQGKLIAAEKDLVKDGKAVTEAGSVEEAKAAKAKMQTGQDYVNALKKDLTSSQARAESIPQKDMPLEPSEADDVRRKAYEEQFENLVNSHADIHAKKDSTIQEQKQRVEEQRQYEVQKKSIDEHAAMTKAIADMEGKVQVAELRKLPNAPELRKQLEVVKEQAKPLESGKASVEDIAKIQASVKELAAPVAQAEKKISDAQMVDELRKAGPAVMIAAAFNPKAPASVQEQKGILLSEAQKSLEPWQADIIKTEVAKNNQKGGLDFNSFAQKVQDVVDAKDKAGASPELGRLLAYTPREQWDAKTTFYTANMQDGKLSPEAQRMIVADSGAAKARHDLEDFKKDTAQIEDPKRKAQVQHDITARETNIKSLEHIAEGSSDWRSANANLSGIEKKLETAQANMKRLQDIELANGIPGVYDKKIGADQKSPAYKHRVEEMKKADAEIGELKKQREIAAKDEAEARTAMLKINPVMEKDPDMVARMTIETAAKAAPGIVSDKARHNAEQSLAIAESQKDQHQIAALQGKIKDAEAKGLPEAADLKTQLKSLQEQTLAKAGAYKNPEGAYGGSEPTLAQKRYQELQGETIDNLATKYGLNPNKKEDADKLAQIKTDLASGKTDMKTALSALKGDSWESQARQAGMTPDMIATLKEHAGDKERVQNEIAAYAKEHWEDAAKVAGMSPDMIATLKEHAGDAERIQNEIAAFRGTKNPNQEPVQSPSLNQTAIAYQPATKTASQMTNDKLNDAYKNLAEATAPEDKNKFLARIEELKGQKASEEKTELAGLGTTPKAVNEAEARQQEQVQTTPGGFKTPEDQARASSAVAKPAPTSAPAAAPAPIENAAGGEGRESPNTGKDIASADINSQIQNVNEQMTTLVSQQSQLQQQLASSTDPDERTSIQDQINDLQQQITGLQQQRQQLVGQGNQGSTAVS